MEHASDSVSSWLNNYSICEFHGAVANVEERRRSRVIEFVAGREGVDEA